jgi:hypothetical protein
VPLLLLLVLGQWGKDLDPGLAQQMLLPVEDDLARILAAPPDDRPRLVRTFIERHGTERIEAIKRFRSPEFKAVFVALLQHDDWHVKHRALLALEHYPPEIDAIWPLLSHPHRRLRERAAITLLRTWDGRKPPADWARIVANEEDFHVRQSFAALARRMEGTLPVLVLEPEQVLGGRGGLLMIPYVEAAEPATAEPRVGKGPPPLATRWTTPLLGWGEEEVLDAPLEPFREGHPGTDKGACLDGAGLYAAADGIVRSLSATEIVLEHVIARSEPIQATYLHAGGVVFVEPNERVTCGQLLGTIGMGFTAENGGCFAHLEYRLGPPAPLSSPKDPDRFLALWVGRTAPLLPELRPLHASLRSAVREAEREEYAKAASLATRARDAAEPGGEAHADAVYLLGLLASVPAKGIERARRLRVFGYPTDALKDLDALGADAEAARWREDPLFEKALKGEPRVEALERRPDADFSRRLLAEYGDTCLRPRIEESAR